MVRSSLGHTMSCSVTLRQCWLRRTRARPGIQGLQGRVIRAARTHHGTWQGHQDRRRKLGWDRDRQAHGAKKHIPGSQQGWQGAATLSSPMATSWCPGAHPRVTVGKRRCHLQQHQLSAGPKPHSQNSFYPGGKGGLLGHPGLAVEAVIKQYFNFPSC